MYFTENVQSYALTRLHVGVPCFPKNKSRLILTFTLKYDTRTYFWECFLFFSLKKKTNHCCYLGLRILLLQRDT